MKEQIKPGDFMLTQGSTPVFSDVVTYYSNPCLGKENENLWAINNGRIVPEEFDPTHVMVITRVDPERELGEDGSIIVVSCDPEGVVSRPVEFEEWKRPWRIMTLIPGYELAPGDLERGNRFLAGTIGAGYDYAGCFMDFPLNADLQDKHRWFCSEHTAMYFYFCGRLLVKRIKTAFIKPRDCYGSAIAMTVARSKN